MHTNLQLWWLRAAQERSLVVQVPFSLQLGDGSDIFAEVLLEGYGARRGMVIVSDFEVIAGKTEALLSRGFGFSCLGQPSDAELSSLEGLDDLLQDWGVATVDTESA